MDFDLRERNLDAGLFKRKLDFGERSRRNRPVVGALRNWFAEDADKEHTLICYESPFRVGATLGAALDALGDREAAVCIELTKMHERVSRGYLSDLVNEFKDAKVKGEVALVIAGSNPKFARPAEAK